MASAKIDARIVKFHVAKPAAKGESKAEPSKVSQTVRMNEKIERPEMLLGSTYKVKTPVSDHAMYVTVNDIVLNEGTPDEQRRPFEIFINSKNLDHFPWIVALTRILSAVFRKGGDVTFLVDELKAVFDPKGGYWQPGGRYMPSIIAELGHIIERHLQSIGMIKRPELDPAQKKFIEEKRAQLAAKSHKPESAPSGAYPPGAKHCSACGEVAVVVIEACAVCLSCSASKCG